MNSYRKSNTRRALGFPVSTSANASFTCSSLHTFVITLVSCRLELKRLSQIDSIPKNRSHYFDNACHDVKNRKCTCWSAGSPTNTAVPPRRRDPKVLFKLFRQNRCVILEGCSYYFSNGLANKSMPDGRKIPRSLRRVTGEG